MKLDEAGQCRRETMGYRSLKNRTLYAAVRPETNQWMINWCKYCKVEVLTSRDWIMIGRINGIAPQIDIHFSLFISFSFLIHLLIFFHIGYYNLYGPLTVSRPISHRNHNAPRNIRAMILIPADQRITGTPYAIIITGSTQHIIVEDPINMPISIWRRYFLIYRRHLFIHISYYTYIIYTYIIYVCQER